MSDSINPERELFCDYYTRPGDTFGVATTSYANAYGYNLDELPKDDEIWKTLANGKKEKIVRSSYERSYSVCAMQGGRLLKDANVLARIQKMRVEKMTDEFVDSELMKVITQDEEKTPKVAAIREFNRLSQRVTDKLDLTSKGESIRTLTDEQLYLLSRRNTEGAGE